VKGGLTVGPCFAIHLRLIFGIYVSTALCARGSSKYTKGSAINAGRIIRKVLRRYEMWPTARLNTGGRDLQILIVNEGLVGWVRSDV
jgi:hypothetical protein